MMETEKEELKAAEKVILDPKNQFSEQVKSLHKIQKILKDCGINPQARTPEILHGRIIQAKEILNYREEKKQKTEELRKKESRGHNFPWKRKKGT